MASSSSPSVSLSRRGSTQSSSACTVVWLRGDHDVTTRIAIAVGIARAAQRDELPVLVDLSAVTFMDASTVGVIVGSRNRLLSRGQSLNVRAPSPPALRVLELCGLAHLVQRRVLPSTGSAAALGTWVDVQPLAHRADKDVRPTTVPAARQPARVLVAADGGVGEALATVEMDRPEP